MRADAVVLAVPPRDAFAVAPQLARHRGGAGAAARHVADRQRARVYDRRVTDLPFAAGGRLAGAVVLRPHPHVSGLHAQHPGAQYLAVTVSAADDDHRRAGRASCVERFTAELRPAAARRAATAEVLDAFVTRERRATFRQAAGQRARCARAAIAGLDGVWLAGAWTATGWPDTMESAVRSGVRAAEAVLRVPAAGVEVRHDRTPWRGTLTCRRSGR